MANLHNFKVFNEWYSLQDLIIEELQFSKIYQLYSNKNSPYRAAFVKKIQIPTDPKEADKYLNEHSIEITKETLYYKNDDSKALYLRNSSGSGQILELSCFVRGDGTDIIDYDGIFLYYRKRDIDLSALYDNEIFNDLIYKETSDSYLKEEHKITKFIDEYATNIDREYNHIEFGQYFYLKNLIGEPDKYNIFSWNYNIVYEAEGASNSNNENDIFLLDKSIEDEREIQVIKGDVNYPKLIGIRELKLLLN